MFGADVQHHRSDILDKRHSGCDGSSKDAKKENSRPEAPETLTPLSRTRIHGTTLIGTPLASGARYIHPNTQTASEGMKLKVAAEHENPKHQLHNARHREQHLQSSQSKLVKKLQACKERVHVSIEHGQMMAGELTALRGNLGFVQAENLALHATLATRNQSAVSLAGWEAAASDAAAMALAAQQDTLAVQAKTHTYWALSEGVVTCAAAVFFGSVPKEQTQYSRYVSVGHCHHVAQNDQNLKPRTA
ncbi:hypothetical protein C8Q80DRAFT_1119402 [Daedaleopsis nitida]|nr:hypothetical protein C8Q80DRAFT_1119402 [Daedaleopsis nitida]